MKVCILYHPESEHSRVVEEFTHDFERIHSQKVELLSLESREGAEKAALYGLVQYPVVMVLKDDSQLQKEWQGSPLPLMDEVMGYLHN